METLPIGIMTFFFTDVGSSMALWEQHPEEMQVAMRRYDALVEGVVEGHGGQVVRPRGEGDSGFAVFARAADAVAAACALQQALAAEEWPLPEPLRVRIALHSGEAELRAGDYYGVEVYRCAHLRNLAHPGQTLLSMATFQEAYDTLPKGVRLKELGYHRLKGLTQPERIFQLVIPNLDMAFPPLRSTNLPVLPTPLMGREQEVLTLSALLQQPGTRLVTVTGAAGVGKTHLGIEVAAGLLDQFQDGVFFVALAALNDPTLVIPTIAETLQVQESGAVSLFETLKSYLRDKQVLLLLDNFERVVEAAPVVAELLLACPGLKLLITSREVLRLREERDFPLLPLALPEFMQPPHEEEEWVAALAEYAVVKLFVQRARAVRPNFTLTSHNAPAIVEICHRLDGLPLTIELAAARVRLFTPRALLARLGDEGESGGSGALRLLTGGGRDLPKHQQTLRSTLAWSYDLLQPGEKALFRRLAAFGGAFTIEAAESICNQGGDLGLDVLDGLSSLLDKSLLRQLEQRDGEPRFFLLRTIREYASEWLEESGEAQAIRDAHAAFYLALAAEVEPYLAGTEQAEWLERLEQAHDNLRAALRWALLQASPTLALRFVVALASFWYWRGYLEEGYQWAAEALQRSAEAPARLRLQALNKAGALAYGQADYTAARQHYEQALTLAKQSLGDRTAIAEPLHGLAAVLAIQGNFRASARLFGAAEDVYEGTDRDMTALYLRQREDLKSQLGVAMFGNTWAQGQAMTLEQAIDYALHRLDSGSL
ncbi:MAG: tetratricopeptide repeat protein [Chloroflexota bacterium]|nr:tetratricopeptide repeat protein [Chloroflexota bacterium]